LGQAAGYALKARKREILAHDRIRCLAQLYRACGCKGWVILFDELERLAVFPKKQRLSAWEELGWWHAEARRHGAAIIPVFAVAAGLVQHAIETDEPLFRSGSTAFDNQDRDARALQAIDMVKHAIRLVSPDRDQEAQIRYRVKDIYQAAYPGVQAREVELGDVTTSIRSQIRRWITYWDLDRCYPNYAAEVVTEDVVHDGKEADESDFAGEEDSRIVE
ncbi:MAG TPA: BREX system ATP-binding domain-containing protein, partial [Chthonomonadales bacterium]|nr:BREX system ATP-binding domain-containing protein [Chthonomonadales bacterium]